MGKVYRQCGASIAHAGIISVQGNSIFLFYMGQYIGRYRSRPERIRVHAADPDASAGEQHGLCSRHAPGFLYKFYRGASQPFDNDGEFQFII